MLNVDFDADKDALNFTLHGVRLKAARHFDLDGALKQEDDRSDYGEVRIKATGRLNRDIFALIYTERHGSIRAISLRKATKDEREQFLATRS